MKRAVALLLAACAQKEVAHPAQPIASAPPQPPAVSATVTDYGLMDEGVQHRPGDIRTGYMTVNGRIPPEVIAKSVRNEFPHFRACYEPALRANPKLQGAITTRFVIDREGHVQTPKNERSDIEAPDMVDCVTRAFSSVPFPAPEGGIVTVVYPLVFAPR